MSLRSASRERCKGTGRWGLPQATTALGSDIFDYYSHHPEETAIFQKTMQASTAGVTAEIAQHLDTSKSLTAVDVGGATGSLLYSLMKLNNYRLTPVGS
jgi:hypothetical protein